jgi:uncharacterized protein YegL
MSEMRDAIDQPTDELGRIRIPGPASRTLITLLLDTSSSMAESGISQLNAALPSLRGALSDNPNIARAGEIAVITFGKDGVQVRDPAERPPFDPSSPYVPVSEFRLSTLQAGNTTPMTQAIQLGLQLVTARKEELRAQGVGMAFRPLMFVVTDGQPTDAEGRFSTDYRSLLPVIQERERLKQLLFYAIGVDQANESVLRELAPEEGQHHKLAGLDFARVIMLVSASVDVAARRDGPGEEAADAIYKRTNERLAALDEFLKN